MSGMIFRFSVPLAPVFRAAQTTSGGFSFERSAVSGQQYQAQYKTSFSSTDWSDLGSPVIATNGVMSARDRPTLALPFERGSATFWGIAGRGARR